MSDMTKTMTAKHQLAAFSHKIGYAAFGTTDDDEPITKTFPHEWPDAELHFTVHTVELRTYGDDEGRSAFIQVTGTNADETVRRWHAVRAAWAELQKVCWP